MDNDLNIFSLPIQTEIYIGDDTTVECNPYRFSSSDDDPLYLEIFYGEHTIICDIEIINILAKYKFSVFAPRKRVLIAKDLHLKKFVLFGNEDVSYTIKFKNGNFLDCRRRNLVIAGKSYEDFFEEYYNLGKIDRTLKPVPEYSAYIPKIIKTGGWIKGKYPGSIEVASNYARLRIKTPPYSKSISFKTSEEKDVILKQLEQHRYEKCVEFGLVSNDYRRVVLSDGSACLEVTSNIEGKNFLCDFIDIGVVESCKWNLAPRRGDREYIQNSSGELFHRKIVDYDVVDHINNIGTDNRRCNLRDGKNGKNAQNMKKSSRNTSGCTGVSKNTRFNRWEFKVMVNGKVERKLFPYADHGGPDKAHLISIEYAKKRHSELGIHVQQRRS